MPYNPRRLYPLVDDKLKTKKIALENGIAVPELLGVVSIQNQIKHLSSFLSKYEDFVIKPAHGSGGKGILVVTGTRGSMYITPSGDLINFDYLSRHVSNILSGMYSLGGISDKALIEYRVKFDPVFTDICYQGVPDIRVILFKGLPVAAMLRLPTRESNGKANLHQGAMGIGIDLVTGKSCGGVYHGKFCTIHPDTESTTTEVKIPNWVNILQIAMRCADAVGLGYLGVDIVLDKELGPLMLELNARPGLNVQIANGIGLRKNLDKVESLESIPSEIGKRIELLKSLASAH